MGHLMEFLAIKLHQMTLQPFIDPINKQKHFDPFLAEYFQVLAVFCGIEVFRNHIVDLVLAFAHALNIFREGREFFAVIMRRIEAANFEDAIAVFRGVIEPFLDGRAELPPESHKTVPVITA